MNSGIIRALIQKDIVTEWRLRYALNGILIQVVSSVFIVFLSIKTMNAPTWNAVFWIILLFAATNAVAKGFIGEAKGRLLYYYQLCSPVEMIIAKMIYNLGYMLLISLVTFLVYSLLLGNYAQDMGFFILVLVLGGIGISTTFTIVSSISSKTGNGHLLMPVLGFPIIIPLILIIIKSSKKAMDGLDISTLLPDLMVLSLFDMMIVVLGVLLFPYLWKD